MIDDRFSIEDLLTALINNHPTGNGVVAKVLSFKKEVVEGEHTLNYLALVTSVLVEEGVVMAELPSTVRPILFVWSPDKSVLRLEVHTSFGTPQDNGEPFNALSAFATEVNVNDTHKLSMFLTTLNENYNEVVSEIAASVLLPEWIWLSKSSIENFLIPYVTEVLSRYWTEVDTTLQELDEVVAEVGNEGTTADGEDEDSGSGTDDRRVRGRLLH